MITNYYFMDEWGNRVVVQNPRFVAHTRLSNVITLEEYMSDVVATPIEVTCADSGETKRITLGELKWNGNPLA